MIMQSALVASLLYFVLYRICPSLLLTHFLPLCTLAVVNVRMCLIIAKARRDRRRMCVFGQTFQLIRQSLVQCGGLNLTAVNVPLARGNPEQIDLTANRALTILLAKFVSCHSLPMALDLCQLALADRVYLSQLFDWATVISNSLVIFNSANNFLVYFWTGNRFRLELTAMVRRFVESFGLRLS